MVRKRHRIQRLVEDLRQRVAAGAEEDAVAPGGHALLLVAATLVVDVLRVGHELVGRRKLDLALGEAFEDLFVTAFDAQLFCCGLWLNLIEALAEFYVALS